MSFSSDLMKYLQEGAEATADIEAVLESVCPTPRFVSDDPYALGLEAINYMDEAYIDIVSYQAEGNQLMLESVNSVDEYKMGVISDSINEGVKEKAQSLGYRMVQAIKGFILKIRKMIASGTITSLKKKLMKTYKSSKPQADASYDEYLNKILVLLKEILAVYNTYIASVRNIERTNANIRTEAESKGTKTDKYGGISKDFASYMDSNISEISEKIKNLKKDSDSGKIVDIGPKLVGVTDVLDKTVGCVNLSIKSWNGVVKRLEDMAMKHNPDDADQYKALHGEVSKLMKYESTVLSLIFKLINAGSSAVNSVLKSGNSEEKPAEENK